MTTSARPAWQFTTRLGNNLGNYHCNNRVYSIQAGRWLSPDQAANPLFNLFDYVGSRVCSRIDPSGLEAPEMTEIEKKSSEYWEARNKFFKNANDIIERFTKTRPFEERRGYRSTLRLYLAREDFWKKCCQREEAAEADSFDVSLMPKDFAHMKELLELKMEKKSCIDKLQVFTHGNPGMMEGKWAPCQDESLKDWPDGPTATQWGEALQKYMCKGKCIIELFACNQAQGAMPQEIANATGCEVRAASGEGTVEQRNLGDGCNIPKNPPANTTGRIEVFFPGGKPRPYDPKGPRPAPGAVK